MRRSLPLLVLSSLSLAACGGDSTHVDGGGTVDMAGVDTGPHDAGGTTCHSDTECDDGVFCNGVAHCAPGDPMADARGCTPMGTTPCAMGQTCNEATRMCLSDCDLHGDADGDGHRAITCGGDDCDDADPNSYPGNPEVCDSRGHDEDCNPATYGPDRDGDGYISTMCCNRQASGMLLCGVDCDDTSMDVSPVAPEVCDGIDDNCNGMIDEGVLLTFYRDADGDSFGLASMTRTGCSLLTGYAFTSGDCDDMDMSVHPGASEVCNMVDDDCNGTVDDAPGGCACLMGPPMTCGTSDGMMGFLTVGACHTGTQSCVGGTLGDCVGAVGPTGETCNGVDDNCNGTTDEGVTTRFYRDLDADGYGDTSMPMQACGAPMGYAPVPNDCNDMRALTYPGAPETCNGMDDNCNGMVDEGVTTTFYRDADGDGYGSSTSTIDACAAPAGYVTMSGDCNDMNAAIHPGAADPCDTIDNNCDGTVDPGCSCTNGTSQPCGTSDGMGGFLMTGICHPGTQTCVSGMWATCSGNVGPVPETCNMLDDDCNGAVDDGVTTNYYRDCDRDGYGATGTTPTAGCMAPGTPPAACPSGAWAANNSDCNDAVATTHPGATDTCNNIDDDCDTVVDGAAANTWCNGAGLPPHTTTAVCTSATSTCTPTVCASQYLDCAPATPGCEVMQSPTNCGMCSHVCGWGNCTTSGLCEDAVDISAGNTGACVVRNGGTVVCWGPNGSGEVGDGTTTSRTTPVLVSGITDAVQVSLGENFACARHATGTVSCWGANSVGQLGDGTVTARHTPVAVMGITDAVQVDAGLDFACVRHATGTVSCWGGGAQGQLGNGATTDAHTPVTVSAVSDAVDVSAGYEHACAVRMTGAVVCWGLNVTHALGDGVATHATCTYGDCSSTPVTVSGLSDAATVSAGGALIAPGISESTCALRTGGGVSCWGDNITGELGDGTTTNRNTPTATSIVNGTQVSMGGWTACARRSTGAAACWGENDYGEVGDGTTTTRTSPTTVSMLSDAAQVTTSPGTLFGFSCARRTSGGVMCWGLAHDSGGTTSTPHAVVPGPL